MIEAWRLVKPKYADVAFQGEGARRAGGRWNSVGTAMVYCSESLALAELEILVNLPTGRLLDSYVAFRVRFPDDAVETLDPAHLRDHWRRDLAPPSVRLLGDAWVLGARSLVLCVPSAVVPSESNYIVNPSHADMQLLTIEGPIDPLLDARLTFPSS